VEPIGRRRALGVIGGVCAGAVVAACSSSTKPSAAPPGTAAPATSGSTAGPATCRLAPEVTQGPFFLTDHPDASNLVQNRPGRHLALTLAVVDQQCAAVPGAKVDVWHCDAAGVYAGVGNGPGGGQAGGDFAAATRATPDTWLQGYQVAGADGTVKFTTIYPGWYPGRAVHIHMKVFVGGDHVHTGQLFFPDPLSARVFAQPPYRGAPDTPNRSDSIFRESGSAALLAPAARGQGFTAHAQLVVRT